MAHISKKKNTFVWGACVALFFFIFAGIKGVNADFSQMDYSDVGTQSVDVTGGTTMWYYPGPIASGTAETITLMFRRVGGVPTPYTMGVYQSPSVSDFLGGTSTLAKNSASAFVTGTDEYETVVFTFSNLNLSDTKITIFSISFNLGSTNNVFVRGTNDEVIHSSICKWGAGYATWVDCDIVNPYFIIIGSVISEVPQAQDFSEYDPWTYGPDIKIYPGFKCISGRTCNYPILANDEAVGGTLYAIEQLGETDSSNCWPENSISDIEIMTPILYDGGQPIELTDELAGTKKYYCFYYEDDGDFFDIVFSGADVTWISGVASSTEYDELFGKYVVDPCGDIATSSGSVWDDIRYGLECAAHKTIVWLIFPGDTAKQMMADQIDIFKRQFPLNVFFDIKSEIETYATSTAGYQPVEIIIDGQNLGNITSTSSVEVLTGTSIFLLYYTWATNAIYIIGLIFMCVILFL